MTRHVTLVVAGLALVAIVGVVLVARGARPGPGSDVAPAAAAQEATPGPTDAPEPTATETAVELDQLRVTQYEVFLARDPFEPVIVSAPANPTTSPTTSPTGSPTTSPTTSPTGSPTTSPTSNPTTNPTTSPTGNPTNPDGCVDTGTVVCDGQVVKLVDVFVDDRPGAVVQVDDTAYEVRAGETFASNFRVSSIESPCATLLYGDDAFTLCEGESTLK